MASTAFAPLHWFLILVPCLAGFLLLIHEKTPQQGLLLGFLFGLGHFSTGLYWIQHAFTVVNMGSLGPIAVMGLASVLAVFPGLVGALTTLWSTTRLQQVWIFSSLWALMEWLRSFIFTGFPWNLIGYTWDTPLLQITAWVGIYGLSFLTVLTATSFASRSFRFMGSTTTLLIVLWAAGSYRLHYAPFLENQDIPIRLVQASIPQGLKWRPEQQEKNLQLYISLSHLEAERPLKIILWPEAAVTIPFTETSPIIDILKTAVPAGGVLITGGIRTSETKDPFPQVYNSLFVLNEEGKILNSYDKVYLTPFGEYVPLKKLLRIEKLTSGSLDFSTGSSPKVLFTPSLPPFQPLICYEGIFPNIVQGSKRRADWFVNLTNDAWFGESWGPYQHLAIVRVRSIEHGIPLIRAANNGISAVVDSYGRILYELKLNQIGFVDFFLPRPIPEPTFYSHWREFPFMGMMIMGLLIGYLCRRKRTG